MKDICGSVCLLHMPITRYKVSFEGECFRLIEDEGQIEIGEALAYLLDCPNVIVGRDDGLVPCFDLNEMTKRNNRSSLCS